MVVASLLFVPVPFSVNLFVPNHLHKVAPHNQLARHFVENRVALLVLATVWTGNLYAVLQLLNCRVFGLAVFHMGLTKSELDHFTGAWKGLYYDSSSCDWAFTDGSDAPYRQWVSTTSSSAGHCRRMGHRQLREHAELQRS